MTDQMTLSLFSSSIICDDEAEMALIEEQSLSANSGPFASVTSTQRKHSLSKGKDVVYERQESTLSTSSDSVQPKSTRSRNGRRKATGQKSEGACTRPQRMRSDK